MMSLAGKSRAHIVTALILTFCAGLLLFGVGGRLIDAYERLTDADYITAVSLVMEGVPESALPVTLLDVDDKTRESWGNPPITPHATLARMIEESARLNATAIVVDYDLTPEDPFMPGDPELLATLSSYPALAPPLMIARKISFVRGKDEQLKAQEAAATPYDEAVAGKPNIRWITTLNDISGDRQVRRIRLWQTVCKDAGGIAYPSAALAAAALLYPDEKHDADLDSFLKSRADSDCRKAPLARMAWPKFAGQAAALPYVFPDRAENRALFRISKDGKQTVVLRRISAGQIVTYDGIAAKLAGELDKDPIEGRVVMIGATHGDASDFFNTPLGTMPGVLILANSIVQAKTIADTAPMNPWLGNFFTLILFLIFAFIARNLHSAPQVIGIGIVSLAGLFVVSRMFSFFDGVNVVAVAVPGFALFKLIDSLAHILLDTPARGWRAIFKH